MKIKRSFMPFFFLSVRPIRLERPILPYEGEIHFTTSEIQIFPNQWLVPFGNFAYLYSVQTPCEGFKGQTS